MPLIWHDQKKVLGTTAEKVPLFCHRGNYPVSASKKRYLMYSQNKNASVLARQKHGTIH